ncbi:hypothetical protein AYK24_03770 [Thermoplasmatales archaeon SG8-52-4]|nr:MAG: hypothetical protein AYK24_03770 [Thermoplasmatales archaeon SG8-52-4]
MKLIKKAIIASIITIILMISSNTLALPSNISNVEIKDNKDISMINNNQIDKESEYDILDFDPLVNLQVTVNIREIRALDDIDLFSEPDFYVVVYINGIKQVSPIWHNKRYIKDDWSTQPVDIPEDKEDVKIKIQLWDKNTFLDKKCDINSNFNTSYLDKKDIDIVYNIKTGHWRGDDYNYPDILSDLSGYGRANGCDDNSIYQNKRDCELWFDITQNDYDNDGIPYWVEKYVFKTDPEVDNTGWDNDSDGVPIEWEYKWGHVYYYNWWQHKYESMWIYDPFVWEDHANLDIDEDGLQNTEEYLTSQWGSDPHRKDIFLEIDQMEISEDKRGAFVPNRSFDLLQDAFARRNIVIRVDDGCMGGGQKDIPFDPQTEGHEFDEIYFKYFLNNDSNYWRRGVFHYSIIVYYPEAASAAGFAFSSEVNGVRLIDCFALGTMIHENIPLYQNPMWYNILRRKTFSIQKQKEIIYAGVMMHETGHVLGIFRGNTPGCDNRNEILKYFNYKSCMNYFYTYFHVDYSDGSHGVNDFDDWDRIDLTRFQMEYN